jgi:RNA polymerase sigma factor (sigma-70 family)
MTERQLLERFLADHDPDAFRVLVETHGPMVIGVCRSVLHDPHDVDDAFQTTFMVLVQRAETITQRECIGPWLHRVALRIATRVRTTAGTRRIRERRASRSEAALDKPGGELLPRSVLDDELNRLPDRYRAPVVLCYLEGKTTEEAASQLRCPVGTVKGRLWRARSKLRERLCRRGVSLRS